MSAPRVQLDQSKLAAFCQRHHIMRLSVFGSVLREDFRPESDIDILIEFLPGQTPSLLDLGGMQVELSQLLGHMVDLKTPGFMSPRVREHVMRHAQVQYDAAA